jgi:hypothetical protein
MVRLVNSLCPGGEVHGDTPGRGRPGAEDEDVVDSLHGYEFLLID